jgi:hypothetical protein
MAVALEGGTLCRRNGSVGRAMRPRRWGALITLVAVLMAPTAILRLPRRSAQLGTRWAISLFPAELSNRTKIAAQADKVLTYPHAARRPPPAICKPPAAGLAASQAPHRGPRTIARHAEPATQSIEEGKAARHFGRHRGETRKARAGRPRNDALAVAAGSTCATPIGMRRRGKSVMRVA